jgi:hypothetical protein
MSPASLDGLSHNRSVVVSILFIETVVVIGDVDPWISLRANPQTCPAS